MEGIYCAERENLPDEVIGVFELLIKKVLDLDHTRGIVMGATSDIDNTVNECLVAIHDKLDGTGQAAMVKHALEFIEKRIASLTKKAGELKADGSMASLFEAHMVFTAYDRLHVLSRALKQKEFDEQVDARKSVHAYMEKVVPDRNILGHGGPSPEGKPTAVVDASGKQISLDETRDLRRAYIILAL